MLNLFRAGRANVLVWALMGLLVVGLAGFGIGTGALVPREIASVGGREVTADAYARALQQELRGISAQVGRSLTIAEARQFGIDRTVLARLVNDAALDAEAERLGLGASDAVVRDQVQATPAFRGAAGGFDPEAYRFALQRTGLTPAEFEAMLRAEAARTLIATGIQSATALPDTAALTLLGYLGERRSFDWLRLGPEALTRPVAPPNDSVVAKFYAENSARYTRPETRRITFAAIAPEALAETIEVPEADLRAAYDAASDRFVTPERRFLDRLGFKPEAEAEAARARLDAGEASFDALAAERGLSADDTDLGSVAAADLAPEARAAVFGGDGSGDVGPGIVGPVSTPLGPSIYRVNAITAARTVPFETARPDLARERALAEAQDRIAGEAAAVNDLVAGGATLEEIAAETDLTLGSLDLNSQTTGGMADDPAFRALAEAARVGEETDLATLDDGTLVTLRVEEVAPPAPIPLAEIRDRVAADWTAAETRTRLGARAQEIAAEVTGDASLGTASALPVQGAGPLGRSETLPGAPPELIADVFAAAPGAVVVRPDGDGVILAQVTGVTPFDPDAAQNSEVLATVRGELRDQAAEDVLALYTAAVREAAGVSVNAGLVESTLAQFP